MVLSTLRISLIFAGDFGSQVPPSGGGGTTTPPSGNPDLLVESPYRSDDKEH